MDTRAVFFVFAEKLHIQNSERLPEEVLLHKCMFYRTLRGYFRV